MAVCEGFLQHEECTGGGHDGHEALADSQDARGALESRWGRRRGTSWVGGDWGGDTRSGAGRGGAGKVAGHGIRGRDNGLGGDNRRRGLGGGGGYAALAGGTGGRGDLRVGALTRGGDQRSGSGSDGASGSAREGVEDDRVALGALALVVDVVKGARQAVVEDGAVAEGEGTITAEAEARGERVRVLRWAIELELMVISGDVAGTSLGVEKHAVLQGEGE